MLSTNPSSRPLTQVCLEIADLKLIQQGARNLQTALASQVFGCFFGVDLTHSFTINCQHQLGNQFSLLVVAPLTVERHICIDSVSDEFHRFDTWCCS